MRGRLFGLAFCLLASCAAGAPAMAQEQKCWSLSAVLLSAGEAKSKGAAVALYEGEQAVLGLEALGALIGPPPREVAITAIIIISHEGKSAVVLGEGDKTCLTVSLPTAKARIIELAITGKPV